MTVFLGIDPGTTGAIAFIGPDFARVADLPSVVINLEADVQRKRIHAPGLQSLILANVPEGQGVYACIEALSASPASTPDRFSSSEVQYRTRGVIEATLELLGLELHEVSVQKWKRFYGLRGGKEAKGESLAKARLLYPELEQELRRAADQNRAEAVLIARYAQRCMA